MSASQKYCPEWQRQELQRARQSSRNQFDPQEALQHHHNSQINAGPEDRGLHDLLRQLDAWQKADDRQDAPPEVMDLQTALADIEAVSQVRKKQLENLRSLKEHHQQSQEWYRRYDPKGARAVDALLQQTQTAIASGDDLTAASLIHQTAEGLSHHATCAQQAQRQWLHACTLFRAAIARFQELRSQHKWLTESCGETYQDIHKIQEALDMVHSEEALRLIDCMHHTLEHLVHRRAQQQAVIHALHTSAQRLGVNSVNKHGTDGGHADIWRVVFSKSHTRWHRPLKEPHNQG
ncbi:MAG: hypothetical protein EA401_00660 [Planctomycetota bacterium]|nr:MAG: hypothetical protein EA401_00660 [Planctomycetota bacterium]